MHTVQDGARTLKFDGVELAFSTSKDRRKFRWIEFRLYRTQKGHYVLSRVGASVIYHHGTCPTVQRNNLDPLPTETLPHGMLPCPDCAPDPLEDELLYPEMPRKWAQVSDTADGVVQSLKQYDSKGTEYLTDVARNLLEDAAKVDNGIASAYFTEWIS